MNHKSPLTTADSCRIVEYATREQAQQAVNTLSNQNLMGRLVYVREVSSTKPTVACSSFDTATASRNVMY